MFSLKSLSLQFILLALLPSITIITIFFIKNIIQNNIQFDDDEIENDINTDIFEKVLDVQNEETNVTFYNIKDEDITIKKGEAIGQAIFEKFLVADNDVASGERIGGFGSTTLEK